MKKSTTAGTKTPKKNDVSVDVSEVGAHKWRSI
jgi:hypothetical protein